MQRTSLIGAIFCVVLAGASLNSPRAEAQQPNNGYVTLSQLFQGFSQPPASPYYRPFGGYNDEDSYARRNRIYRQNRAYRQNRVNRSQTRLNRENAVRQSTATRHIVEYSTNKKPGSIVIETGERALYYVLANGKAIRYAVGVGRQGFQWSGVHKVSRKAEWPRWTPPAEMRKRQPGLPVTMAGGPNNPLGARALYIGSTLYRIHGTNDPNSIGRAMSSGCIRLMNEDVIDLYNKVKIGARVYVYH